MMKIIQGRNRKFYPELLVIHPVIQRLKFEVFKKNLTEILENPFEVQVQAIRSGVIGLQICRKNIFHLLSLYEQQMSIFYTPLNPPPPQPLRGRLAVINPKTDDNMKSVQRKHFLSLVSSERTGF
jgi:hypothetical protein